MPAVQEFPPAPPPPPSPPSPPDGEFRPAAPCGSLCLSQPLMCPHTPPLIAEATSVLNLHHPSPYLLSRPFLPLRSSFNLVPSRHTAHTRSSSQPPGPAPHVRFGPEHLRTPGVQPVRPPCRGCRGPRGCCTGVRNMHRLHACRPDACRILRERGASVFIKQRMRLLGNCYSLLCGMKAAGKTRPARSEQLRHGTARYGTVVRLWACLWRFSSRCSGPR